MDTEVPLQADDHAEPAHEQVMNEHIPGNQRRHRQIQEESDESDTEIEEYAQSDSSDEEDDESESDDEYLDAREELNQNHENNQNNQNNGIKFTLKDLLENPEEHQIPLYDGSPITSLESYFSILQFLTRFNLSKECAQSLLNLIHLHIPLGNEAITTTYQLYEFFSTKDKRMSTSCHYCQCSYVFQNPEELVCPCCETQRQDSNYFIMFNFEVDIQTRFEDPKLFSILLQESKMIRLRTKISLMEVNTSKFRNFTSLVQEIFLL